jgi:hypothetical protein
MSGSARPFAACFYLLGAGAFCLGAAHAEPTVPTEYEVKAAFIYNFAKYIRWPEGSEAKKTFRIGLIGKDPFGRILDDAVRDQSVEGRPIVLRRFESVEEVADCDILFIGASEKDNLKRILEVARKAPVLTVADMDQFAELGGMINLTTEERRVRFEMNVEAAERAGLKPGSKLLRLARIVSGPQGARR